MIRMPYIPDAFYDDGFASLIDSIKITIAEKNDDILIVCGGETGTGKTSLGLHGEDRYMGDKASVDYIGLKMSYVKGGIYGKADFSIKT